MYGPDGRPSGTVLIQCAKMKTKISNSIQAEVTFRTEADAKAAMAKHRQNMGSRLISIKN